MDVTPAEDLEHDKSAAQAVQLAVSQLNKAIGACAKRNLMVKLQTETYDDFGRRHRFEMLSADVMKVL